MVGNVLFAVLAELKRMQERISLIEAKLARSRQSADHLSTEHLLPASQTSTACMIGQFDVAQRCQNVCQKSVHTNQSSSEAPTVATVHSGSSCSASNLKSQVSGNLDVFIFFSILILLKVIEV